MMLTNNARVDHPLLGTACRRDLLRKLLEEVRQRHRFVVLGYVIMPEHFHLLISEPQDTTPSVVMQVLKQRFARQVLSRWRKTQAIGQGSLWPQGLEISGNAPSTIAAVSMVVHLKTDGLVRRFWITSV